MEKSRQLAVIMFTDIVGFTALMGKSEENTFAILEQNRAIHNPIIKHYNGTFIKELGDGIMASFKTASEAVHAALQIQKQCNEANTFQLRIGLHLGEIVFENGDVFGDGVNIAARIQSAAEPNSIFVSESIHQNVFNKDGIGTEFVGVKPLKNVSSEIRLYKVFSEAGSPTSKTSSERKSEARQELNSIAVLPFANMSNDESQEYFCDGISEEIIDTLTQLENLRVIARTSAFSFKGKHVDVREIGKILGASALLEGSVRKSGNRLRITTKLLQVSNGSYLWTQKYDRQLEDVFAIQEDIAESVATELKGYLSQSEKEVIQIQKTDPEAYQYYLKGRQHYQKAEMQKAKSMFEQAIAIDPEYSPALAFLANTHCYLFDWWGANKSDLEAAEKYSYKGLLLSPEMAECHVAYAFVLAHLNRIPEAEKAFTEAIRLNPNSYDAYYLYARVLFSKGNYDQAAEYFQKAADVRKEDFQSVILLAQVLQDIGDPRSELKRKEGLDRVSKQLELDPNDIRALSIGAMSFYYAGDEDKAIGMIDKALELNPEELTVLYNGACLFAQAGLKDRAIDLLEVALKKGFGHKDWIEKDSDYDSLRDEPRYIELMKNI